MRVSTRLPHACLPVRSHATMLLILVGCLPPSTHSTAGACPSSCAPPSFCPLSVLSAQRWAEPSGATLIRSSWRGLTNGTDVLTLGASKGLAAVALIFSSPDSVTCFLARQLSTSSSTGLRLSLPLASSAIVSISRASDGSCPATSPHFGTASTWVADILALKLNVLYTRLLAGVAGSAATALETAVIGSAYGMPVCECRTVGTLLRDAELYLSGDAGNDGAPPYDLCATDIVLQYGDPSCRTSPYTNWLCYNVTLAAQPSPPPFVEPHFPPYQPYTPDAPPPGEESVPSVAAPPPRKSPPPVPAKSPPPSPVAAKSPPPSPVLAQSPPPPTVKSPPPCLARGSTIGTPYTLTYTNESRAEEDSMYCFQVGLNQCDRPRCCGMRLEQIQFLIDDNCYGSVYGVHVNGKPRSPSYHVYDVRGSTYTVLKLSGFGLTLQQAEGATLCFSLRSSVCPDLYRLCAGPVCQLTLANQPGRQKSSCCPPQDLLLP
eukprot:XP_001693246.1 predicted protein [Chlamydomonas reinhardtii]